MSDDGIRELVAEALEASPYPERLDQLDRDSQRRVRREAERAGIEPQRLYAISVAAATAGRGWDAEADRIAELVKGDQ